MFNAGGGRSSVEAWYNTALAIEEALSGAVDHRVHLFVADVVKSFDTVDRGIAMFTLNIMPMFVFASSWLRRWTCRGHGRDSAGVPS